jgi:hypothetical protein
MIPSASFVVQQSLDFSSWTNLIVQPVLNLTNLQNEISVSPTDSIGFYRLATP